MVSAADVIAMAQTQINSYYSGEYDALNGNHEWPWWCESFVESTHRNLGLSVPAQDSALTASDAYDLQPGRPPAGAVISFWSADGSWSAWGHTAISLGDGSCVGTVTDSRGVAVNWWNEQSNGFLGWYMMPGVADSAPDPPPTFSIVVPDNPYGEGIVVGGGFYKLWSALGVHALPIMGFPLADEEDALVDGAPRVIQRFERLTMVFDATASAPWDVTTALLSSEITANHRG